MVAEGWEEHSFNGMLKQAMSCPEAQREQSPSCGAEKKKQGRNGRTTLGAKTTEDLAEWNISNRDEAVTDLQ